MSQVFRPYANTIARAGLAGIFLGPVVLGVAITSYNWSPYVTEVDEVRSQPVPFSHKHHVSGLGLDCRYCHTTVEDSSFANIPPVKTCMTCHSQIWVNSPMLAPIRESYASGIPIRWTRVYDLPDFVYFNHSIHVNKGIGCSTCHGRIDKEPLVYQHEPLFMAWCVHCHRDPAPNLRPRDKVFDMDWEPPKNQAVLGAQLMKEYHVRKLDQCYTCHR